MRGDKLIGISALFMFFCFYFTLTFIETMIKGEDEHATGQRKIAALICFGIALIIPVILII